MGVTTRKNIIPITSGEIILPNNKPNLNQRMFSGDKILAFSKPNIKNINEMINDHSLIPSLLINGYKEINKKTKKNTIPKLLLELILTSSI